MSHLLMEEEIKVLDGKDPIQPMRGYCRILWCWIHNFMLLGFKLIQLPLRIVVDQVSTWS